AAVKLPEALPALTVEAINETSVFGWACSARGADAAGRAGRYGADAAAGRTDHLSEPDHLPVARHRHQRCTASDVARGDGEETDPGARNRRRQFAESRK